MPGPLRSRDDAGARRRLAAQVYSKYRLNVSRHLPESHGEVLRTFARVGQALGHPARLRLLTLLTQAPKTVSTLSEACGESVANTSAHLAVLSAAGLVVRQRDGRHIRYAVAHAAVPGAVTALRHLGEAVAPDEAREHFERFAGDDVADLTPRALRGAMRDGIALVDVRPPDEYAAGHLPGARSLPVARLADHGVPAGPEPLLVYCRGKYCTTAIEGVRLLTRTGRAVKRLPFGVAEWTSAGYALERA